MFHLFFFFFQAEDGIRDGHVTGVQTCALPILTRLPPAYAYVYVCCSPSCRGAPTKSCSVPGVVPAATAFWASISGPNGSSGSGMIGPGGPMLPFGSIVTCCGALNVTVVPLFEVIVRVPSNSFTIIVPSGLM